MIRGERLTRVLRGVLHHHTFELFVAPAIADLQHSRGVSAYAAVWTSFAGALSEDLIIDTRVLLDDLGLLLGLIAMQACYYGGMLLILVADVRADEILDRLANGAAFVMVTVFCVVMASIIPTLLCFWPPRRTQDA